MVFQGCSPARRSRMPEVAIGFPVAVGMLALTSGLAAACFVKAFGISFLAMPRSDLASDAVEAAWPMRAAMWFLGLAACILGIAASAVVPVLYRIVGSVAASRSRRRAQSRPTCGLRRPRGSAPFRPRCWPRCSPRWCWEPLPSFGRAMRRTRLADTWGCGRIGQSSRMEYTAAAFAQPLLRVFAEFYRPTKDVTVSAHPESRYFVRSITSPATYIRGSRCDFDPIFRLVRLVSTRARKLQAGSAHLYLLYVVVALLVALASCGGSNDRGGGGRAADGDGGRPCAAARGCHPLDEGSPAGQAGRSGVAAVCRAAQAVRQGNRRVARSHRGCSVRRRSWCSGRAWCPRRWCRSSSSRLAVDRVGDLFALVYLLLLGTFFLALAGLDTRLGIRAAWARAAR